MKFLLRMTWPEGVAALLGLLAIALPQARRVIDPFLPGYPVIVLGAGLLLGFRFGRFRLLAGLLTLLVADRTLALFTPGPILRSAPGELIAILLPLNLALVTFFRDGTLIRSGRRWLILLAVQAVAVAAAARFAPRGLVRGLALPIFPVAFLERLAIPHLSLVAFLAAIALIATRVGNRDSSARGLLWATIASFFALNSVLADRTYYLATGGLALAVATVEASYALAFQDDLTGLPGRRAFNQALAALEGSYVVAMVDVDHFKQFNDRFGHDVGDQVLKLVANRLSAIEGGGRPFRYGGEEFAVIFPDSALAEAEVHLEALRENIESTTFTLRGKDRPKKPPEGHRRSRAPRRRDISVTVSIGVAAAGSKKSGAAVVKAADQNLYRAKDTGRNRVIAG